MYLTPQYKNNTSVQAANGGLVYSEPRFVKLSKV